MLRKCIGSVFCAKIENEIFEIMPAGGARPGSGTKKGSLHESTLSRLAEQEILREALRPHAAKVAQALADKASSGDIPAIKEFHDRWVGKAIQQIEGTGEGGAIVIKWEE